jgi:hypothetical protein
MKNDEGKLAGHRQVGIEPKMTEKIDLPRFSCGSSPSYVSFTLFLVSTWCHWAAGRGVVVGGVDG